MYYLTQLKTSSCPKPLYILLEEDRGVLSISLRYFDIQDIIRETSYYTERWIMKTTICTSIKDYLELSTRNVEKLLFECETKEEMEDLIRQLLVINELEK